MSYDLEDYKEQWAALWKAVTSTPLPDERVWLDGIQVGLRMAKEMAEQQSKAIEPWSRQDPAEALEELNERIAKLITQLKELD